MATTDSSPTSGHQALLLDALLDELANAGFPRAGIELRLRIARLLNRFSEKELPTATKLKYQLAALCCQSPGEQEKFYQIFDSFLTRPEIANTESSAVDTDIQLLPKKPDSKHTDESLPVNEVVNKPLKSRSSALPATTRSGPIALELTFYDDGFRPWNLPELEPIVRAWREKEWAIAEDWDIPASIRRTIRAGGVPYFSRRRRRKAPLYLFLIEQQSPRDHLAALYADLVLELQRRDVDADYYFYGDEPHHCWKDRRNPAGYVTIEQLLGAHDNGRLILVGQAEGLLDLNNMRLSPLALQLQEDWAAVALLCTRSTAAWGASENLLSHLFPVAPAGLAGLGSLLGQWINRQSYTRPYWQSVAAEPVIPALDEMTADPAALPKIIRNLKAYLGKQGFQWLCAVAVYPEVYWPLTKLLHDEVVPTTEVPDEGLRRQVWLFALRRLARLDWLRRGALPPKIALELRKMLAPHIAVSVRTELLKVLGLDENKRLPEHSYARQDRVYTVAILELEQGSAQPELTDSQRIALEAAFREQVEREQISLTDIANAVGRDLLRQFLQPALPPGLQVLWVDDEPKNNARFQAELNELMPAIFTNVRSTEEAIETLDERGFDMIVSDVSRYRRDDEGGKMLRVFREKRVVTPVIFYTTPAMVDRYEAELRELGAAGVFYSHELVRNFMREQLQEKQRQNEPASNASPENISQRQSQRQPYTPPPDARIAAAKAAQKAGEDAMETQKYEAAAAAYQQALNLFTELKDNTGRANTNQALGKLYVETGNLESALQHFKSASTLYLLLDFNPAYAYALMDIGSVQRKMGLLADAEKSYEEAMEILEELGDEENLVEVRGILSKISNQRDIPQVKEKIRQMIAENKTEQAFSLLLRNLPTTNKQNDSLITEENQEASHLQMEYVHKKSDYNRGLINSEQWQVEQDRINNRVLEIARRLEDDPDKSTSAASPSVTQQGLMCYYIPATMQVGKKTRCSVRIATTIEMLEKDWQVRFNHQESLPTIADTMSVELAQSTEHESGEWVFDIQRHDSPSKQKINPSRYAQWNFVVEPEQVGIYRLKVIFNLFGQEDRIKKGIQRVTYETQVTVTALPTKKTKPPAQPKMKRRK